jgi:hypothetical protein
VWKRNDEMRSSVLRPGVHFTEFCNAVISDTHRVGYVSL